jgi:flagellin
MSMVINSNIASLTAQRHLSQSRVDMETAMERMSSGKRINSSMDDAAGLAIGNRMTSQIEGLNQAVRNANDGISLAQTAEGTLDAHSAILQRMRVLAVQAGNDTYSTLDKQTLNNEFAQLKDEINRNVTQASFNGQQILDGTNTSFTFQVGHTADDTVTITLADMSGSEIGTKTWADKGGVTPPTAAPAGPIAGATAGSNPVAGASPSTAAANSVVLSAGSSTGDIAAITVGGIPFSHTFTADTATASDAADAFVVAWNANSTAGAAYTASNSSGTLVFTAPSVVDLASAPVASAVYTQATGAGKQESYDFSNIALIEGDLVSMEINGKTYTQYFVTDKATTLNALGGQVVKGADGYDSKAIDGDKLVFTGPTNSTALDSNTVKVKSSSVTGANSIDDQVITDTGSSAKALTIIDDALEMMADFRSKMGAASNRMFMTVDNLMNASENTASARSRIVDADFALESANLAKAQILQKAGTAMLSQANASTQDILSLLK